MNETLCGQPAFNRCPYCDSGSTTILNYEGPSSGLITIAVDSGWFSLSPARLTWMRHNTAELLIATWSTTKEMQPQPTPIPPYFGKFIFHPAPGAIAIRDSAMYFRNERTKKRRLFLADVTATADRPHLCRSYLTRLPQSSIWDQQFFFLSLMGSLENSEWRILEEFSKWARRIFFKIYKLAYEYDAQQ